jgi:von Willebrand factor type A domain/Aerotolerance regulator N-terminal
MTLATPTALFLLALAAPVALLYLLKVRWPQVPVSGDIFWERIFEEKKHRSLWRRLRHPVSLLVQLALLLLLVFAVAEPFFPWEAQEARRVVLVLDNSASMNADDGGGPRLGRVRERAAGVLDALRFRDEAALVAAGTQPQVLCGMTGDRRTLRAALAAVPATDGPTRVVEAVALARRLLVGDANGRVVVVSDGCFEGAKRLAESADVRLIAVGRPVGNVGITQFQARRSLRDVTGYEILVEVKNYSEEAVECRVDLDLNGTLVDVLALQLPPGGGHREVLEKASAEGGRLTARLDRPDALAADNQAWALLPPRQPLPVTLVTRSDRFGDLYVEKALEANPLVQQPLTVVPQAPGAAADRTVTVFHHRVPKRLPPGPLFVIDPIEPCDLWEMGGPLQTPVVGDVERDSPLLTNVRLENVQLIEAHKITPRGAARALVRSVEGEPLYLAFDRPEGKVLVLTVNLDQSELPLRTAFPILAGNALTWLAGYRDELREAVPTGAVVEVALPTAAGELQLWAPDGRARRLPGGGTQVTVGPLDQCGVWRIAADADGPAVAEVACNLASAQESNLRPTETWEEQPEPPVGGLLWKPVWFYLVCAAWLLAAVEWLLYQRRWLS